ncbi:hypothetical protein VTL71DRAFT_14816 [Oculimacula yallundae]|uniref:Major facilitator superfamily (MFS) profile domain-containing protein n=1 Tax=Oculimacula yallundae TaxID=86028 RepID=A0ABR4CJJ8_9HELO
MSTSFKSDPSHIEVAILNDEKLRVDRSKVQVSGTVQLTAGKIVYIPAPTADPRVSVIGLGMVSEFGGLLSFYILEYVSIGKGRKEISYMLSLPNLTMGFGNQFGMPLAVAIGRRSVLLVAIAIMCASIGLCAGAGTAAANYDWHLWARMMLGVAAGQSEALVPIITQEIFFLHERAKYLIIQQTIQTIAMAIFVLFTSSIAAAIGTAWWYGIGCCLYGICFIISFFFVPKMKYYSPQSSYQEATKGEGSGSEGRYQIHTERPKLDFENFEPRTFTSDIRFWIGKPEWSKA